MDGIKKAALFLSSLDCTVADQLMNRLDAESAKIIRREIRSLRNHDFTIEESHRLDREFLRSAGWEPTREYQLTTPKPVTYTSPKRPSVRNQEEKYKADAFLPPLCSFDFMQNWSVNDIVTAIIHEHPQTITVVLAHLPQSKMKLVLSVFPKELQREIKYRLDQYEIPDTQIVQEIESVLKTRYRQQYRSVRSSLILESFDDLETLSDSALATLFRSIDLTTAMLAMIGADVALIARITKHFSPTEEHYMRKQLQQLGSIDDEDIEHARRRILEQHNGSVQF